MVEQGQHDDIKILNSEFHGNEIFNRHEISLTALTVTAVLST